MKSDNVNACLILDASHQQRHFLELPFEYFELQNVFRNFEMEIFLEIDSIISMLVKHSNKKKAGYDLWRWKNMYFDICSKDFFLSDLEKK